MGLFGGSTKTYVSSVIYNLAGDEELRPNFLKSTVSQSVLMGQEDRGRQIVDAHLAGPAMTQRGFYRWAKTRYPHGMATTEVVGAADLDSFDFTPYVPKADPGNTITVEVVNLENADYTYWAEKYLLENRPEDLDTNWTCDYVPTDEEVEITYEDTSTERIDASDYDPSSRYFFIQYTETVPGDPGADPVVPNQDFARMWIYKIGSGVTDVDLLDSSSPVPGEFIPFIPLRLWNKPVDHSNYANLYPLVKKAYKQATGKAIEVILEQIEDNNDVADIDFCALFYAVPLNTKDNSARIYLYEFFKKMMPYQTWTPAEYNAWASTNNKAGGDKPPVDTTLLMQTESAYTGPWGGGSIFFGAQEYGPFDIRISWVNIDEKVGIGLAKPDAKSGDCWFQILGNEDFRIKTTRKSQGEDGDEVIVQYKNKHIETARLYHQVSETSYRYLEIRGLKHQNYIYKYHSVDIFMKTALNDNDESGFIVPMHIPTMKEGSLVHMTQACTNNQILVFNCYERVKKKWYQTGFFKIIFTVVVAVVTAFVFPGAAGLLGANMAVGVSLGLTGTAALVAGAIANALAAVVLTTVMQNAFGDLFGEFGDVIAAIATFVAAQYINSFATTGSFSVDWGSVMRIDNLIGLTRSVANMTQAWARGEIASIQGEFEDITEDYEKRLDEIEKMTQELLGYGGGVIDPLMFTQFSDNPGAKPESVESFLARTLLTGTDLAEVSQNLITDFSDISLTLPDYRQ